MEGSVGVRPGNFAPELNLPKAERKAKLATIPPELANCVADYAERLLETSHEQAGLTKSDAS